MTYDDTGYWIGQCVVEGVDADNPHESAIDLALILYGQAVVERTAHIHPPYLQVVDDDLWWFAEAHDLDEPEASVFKASVLREYVRQGVEVRLRAEG